MTVKDVALLPSELYRHYDEDGRLLYVGVSLSTVARLQKHKKTSHWFTKTADVKIERFPTRSAALEAERKAVEQEKPLYNIRLQKTGKPEIVKYTDLNETKTDLTNRVVQTGLLWREDDVPLPLTGPQLRAAMDRGQLGYLEFPNRDGTKMKRYVTGWQLLDYLEAVAAAQAKTA